jgi:hypothetical protein
MNVPATVVLVHFSVALVTLATANGANNDVPAELVVRGSKIATVHAKGVQIYVCVVKDGKRVWDLKAPEATFIGTDSVGKALRGKHYEGPTWECTTDGSMVKGKIIRKHDSAGAIPLLLLEASSHERVGTLSTVKFIQRLKTTGGTAPDIADARVDDEVRVPYTADYVFYGSDATTQPASRPSRNTNRRP